MTGTVIEGRLGFARPEDVVPDDERPGLLRALARSGTDAIDYRRCRITDWAAGDFDADLREHGFGVADLSDFAALQQVFARVGAQRCITEEDAAAIRAELADAILVTSAGVAVRIQFISDDGLYLRTAGPNGLRVDAARRDTLNDHDAAVSIHADQDVLGTPMKQIMDGRAPELFRHDGPDTSNHEPSMMLLNVWIPVQQVTRPLVLADSTSLDRSRQQLRYGLVVDSFLERSEDQRVNDIWSFLPDPDQRWYFRSDLTADAAYLFDTFGTAHGSFILPGEDHAEVGYLMLEAAEVAVAAGDVDALGAAVRDASSIDPAAAATAPLREALSAMAAVLGDARADAAFVCGEGASAWLEAAAAARERVVRRSIEMRIVATLL